MSTNVYKVFTDVPLWKIDGNTALPKAPGDDTDDAEEMAQHERAEADVAAADKDQLVPSEDKQSSGINR